MNPIQNFDDLQNFLTKKWKVNFQSYNNDYDLKMQFKNDTLKKYLDVFGNYIDEIASQDFIELRVISDLNNEMYLQFINENSGNWSLATLKESNKVFCNLWWIDFDKQMNEFEEMKFELDECLISYTLQEVFFSSEFRMSLSDSKIDILKNKSSPIWSNKHYTWNDPSHSFFYDNENEILIFEHLGNNFFEIVFNNFEKYEKYKHYY